MAQHLYGASAADYLFVPSTGLPAADEPYYMWSARTGGTQVSMSATSGGAMVTTLNSDAFGGYRFWGPDNTLADLWLSPNADGSGTRYRVSPADDSTRLATAEGGLATEITNRGTAVAGAQAAAIAAGIVYTDQQMDALAASANPFPQYGRLVDGSTGLSTGGRIIVVAAGGSVPPPEPGSVLIYGGGV